MIIEDYIKKFDILIYGKSVDNFKVVNINNDFGDTTTCIQSPYGEKLYFKYWNTTPEMTSEIQNFLNDHKYKTVKDMCQTYQIDIEKFILRIINPLFDALDRILMIFYQKDVSTIPEETLKVIKLSVFYYYAWLLQKGHCEVGKYPEIYSDLGKESVSN